MKRGKILRYKTSTFIGTCLASSVLLISAFSGSQSDPRPARTGVVDTHALLGRPGGLEKLAKLKGNFVIQDRPFHCWDYSVTLDALINGSSEIALVTIQSKKSNLFNYGENIYTDYVFQPIEIFKGTFSKDEIFSVLGGKVVFPDKTSAEIRTIESQNLTVGSQYVLFFRESGDHYVLASGWWSVVQVSSNNIELKPLPAPDDDGLYPITKEIRNYTPESLKAFIRNQIAPR